MVCCFAPGCNHNNDRDWCRFFRFPKDKKVLARWIKIVRRVDKTPTYTSFLCSCHFLDGKKENGPSIFAQHMDKALSLPDLNVRKKRKTNTKKWLKLADSSGNKDEFIFFRDQLYPIQVQSSVPKLSVKDLAISTVKGSVEDTSSQVKDIISAGDINVSEVTETMGIKESNELNPSSMVECFLHDDHNYTLQRLPNQAVLRRDNELNFLVGDSSPSNKKTSKQSASINRPSILEISIGENKSAVNSSLKRKSSRGKPVDMVDKIKRLEEQVGRQKKLIAALRSKIYRVKKTKDSLERNRFLSEEAKMALLEIYSIASEADWGRWASALELPSKLTLSSWQSLAEASNNNIV